ncbi:MAG: nucleotidyltransferase domain-containing protein [Candidatus Freyarchaeota archaeon]|nr:nucleotidyltransferase domain-containing protein [Candidatus Freyarchaeota archaeon]
MDKRIKELINQIKEHLIKVYGKKVKQVILYGSHARGQATKDSDIDVLVVVDDSLNPSKVRESLGDTILDILLEKGELVSVLVVPEHLFKNYNSPFLLNVKSEGVLT